MRFRKSRINYPHERRTDVCSPDHVRRDPETVIKNSVWKLIRHNSLPLETPIYSPRPRQTPVQQVSVQTFYASYPPGLEAEMGALNEDAIASRIIEEMVRDEIFEPYLIDKIGQAEWETAKANDEQNNGFNARREAAANLRLVEVFVYMDPKRAIDGQVLVVGRESLSVEVTRLRNRKGGRPPDVLASIQVGSTGFVNPHLREYQRMSGPDRRRRNRPILILEGRNAHEFVIGSHHYDDVEVPGMNDDEWYTLKVNSPSGFGLTTILQDPLGNPVIPGGARNVMTGLKQWTLERRGSGNQEWTCTLTFTNHGTRPLSDFPDAPEIPPAITLVGRVLPRSTTSRVYRPEPFGEFLRTLNLEISSGITLEEDFYLYATAPNDEVYLYDKRRGGNVIVTDSLGQSVQAEVAGFRLDEGSKVSIGGMGYTWYSYHMGAVSLPPEIIGSLEYEVGKNPIAIMDTPIEDDDPNRWMIGNWNQGLSGALDLGCNPIFLKNPDPLLGRNGNLIIKYGGRDPHGHPLFQLLLKKTNNPLLFTVKAAADPDWQTIPWPAFSDDPLHEIGNVVFNGERNNLIFATSYYRVKTTGTKTS